LTLTCPAMSTALRGPASVGKLLVRLRGEHAKAPAAPRPFLRQMGETGL
jgi:hypothetical protein